MMMPAAAEERAKAAAMAVVRAGALAMTALRAI
jgi:hypothetical protein